MKSRLTLIVLALALSACDAQQKAGYSGVLYFGQDAFIMRFSLHDGSLSVAGRLGDTTIREVSAMGPEYLLLSESASVNRQRVSRISWFNLKTGESADLYQGVLAVYLAQRGIVVYDDGRSLYAVPQLEGSDNEIIYEHPQNQLTQLVEATPGTLLFEAGADGEYTIYSWDSETRQLDPLNALTATCRLQGAVWIEPEQRLACKRRSGPLADAEYVLAGLDGTEYGALGLPGEKQFLALAYIQSQHILVLRETWQGLLGGRDKHAVWAFEPQSGAMSRLAENVNLGSSVVYAEF